MRRRPPFTRTLRGSVGFYAFVFEAVLLLGAFAAIDLLLWRSLELQLDRTTNWLANFLTQHEVSGRDHPLAELQRDLGSRPGILMEIHERGEI